MCDHCGCRGVDAIRELMDEHTALVDQAHQVRQALSSGDRAVAMSGLADLVAHLTRHVEREEDGIFRALRRTGEFLDEIHALEDEHRDFEKAVAELHVDSLDFEPGALRLLDDLAAHVDREDYGIFPVSVVTLGAVGWTLIDRVHARSPSFLLDAEACSRGERGLRSASDGGQGAETA
jgi:hemerythrin-like domain-containing protein